MLAGALIASGRSPQDADRRAPGHWGHARCVGGTRPDVRSWLEDQASSRPSVEIP